MHKMLKAGLIFFLSMIIVVELLALAASADDAGMVLVHRDSEREWYVNTLTLVSPAPGLVSFWNRIVPSKSGALFSQMGSMLKEAGINPKKLEYVQTLLEMDCSSNRTTVWSLLYYDRMDRIVRIRTVDATAHDRIVNEQSEESVRKTVCASTRGQNAVKRDILARSDEAIATAFNRGD